MTAASGKGTIGDRPARAGLGSRWLLAGLLLVLLLGAYLRFHDLGEESLWNDELESWRQSSFDTLPEVVNKGVRPDTHPPAFQILLFGVMQTLGDTESELRLISALSGLASIGLIYLIGNEFFGGWDGLLAAFFMAVMWAPIRYSQEARNYALAMLLALAVGYFWMRIAIRTAEGGSVGRGTWAGFVLTGAGAAYTHYFGLLLVALLGLYLLLLTALKGERVGRTLAVGAAILLLYAPWLPSMVEQTRHTDRISWIQVPDLTAFPAYLSFAFNRLHLLGLLAIVLIGWLLWKLVKRYQTPHGFDLAGIVTSPEAAAFYWLGAPMLAAFFLSRLWTPIFTQRNLLVCLPAVYLLLARGITRLPARRFVHAAVALGIGGLALYNLVFSMGYYRFDQKDQFREAVRYVVDRSSPSRDPYVIGYSRFPEYFDYYFDHFGSDLEIELSAGENEDVERLRERLDAVNPDRIWFLAGHSSPDDGFLEALQEDYELIDHRAFVLAEVRMLVKRGE